MTSRPTMDNILKVGVVSALFLSIGIGLWDAVHGLHALAEGAAFVFAIGVIVNSWAA
jgi:hypothetical protein